MGIIRTLLRLANDAKPELEEIEAEALVETGALHPRARGNTVAVADARNPAK